MTIYIRKMQRKEIINRKEEFVRRKMADFDSGYGQWHVVRLKTLCNDLVNN
jgi:hypothetical protein